MLETLAERFGDPAVLFGGGLMVGLLFGVAAQYSKFCLRSATIDVAEGRAGEKLAIWLVTFAAAVIGCQAAIRYGYLDIADTRQIGGVGSLSGAIIGGLMFGVGMIMARGCASRLLVLSGTGNLRALITGLLLTIVAQASLRGGLSPAREAIAALWTVEGGTARDLLAWLGIGTAGGLAIGALTLAIGIGIAVAASVRPGTLVAAAAVGAAVALGWVFTYAMTQVSFDPVVAGSVSFTGPSADTLMGFVNERTLPLDFNVGLVPGVFLGAAAMALLTREFRLQGFEGGPSMLRYFGGAGLMGFGAMLAGGCAVGAGVTGGAIFALTAWLALFSMWVGAVGAHWMDRSFAHRAAARPGTAAA